MRKLILTGVVVAIAGISTGVKYPYFFTGVKTYLLATGEQDPVCLMVQNLHTASLAEDDLRPPSPFSPQGIAERLRTHWARFNRSLALEERRYRLYAARYQHGLAQGLAEKQVPNGPRLASLRTPTYFLPDSRPLGNIPVFAPTRLQPAEQPAPPLATDADPEAEAELRAAPAASPAVNRQIAPAAAADTKKTQQPVPPSVQRPLMPAPVRTRQQATHALPPEQPILPPPLAHIINQENQPTAPTAPLASNTRPPKSVQRQRLIRQRVARTNVNVTAAPVIPAPTPSLVQRHYTPEAPVSPELATDQCQ